MFKIFPSKCATRCKTHANSEWLSGTKWFIWFVYFIGNGNKCRLFDRCWFVQIFLGRQKTKTFLDKMDLPHTFICIVWHTAALDLRNSPTNFPNSQYFQNSFYLHNSLPAVQFQVALVPGSLIPIELTFTASFAAKYLASTIFAATILVEISLADTLWSTKLSGAALLATTLMSTILGRWIGGRRYTCHWEFYSPVFCNRILGRYIIGMNIFVTALFEVIRNAL